ncbi:hypothetical protein ISN44_As13g012070 [Arabidopsis suecica]|uniref:Uncharacterized protein n=1 Tax=Arabidopsis suecica TaxID=45249 RepID=A0A8T1XZD8_ARASU|nr:hypothetical protein ISN44_As13g012070 [Arabidopsis suecica]
MIHRSEFVLTLMVMVSILYAGDVVSMGHLYYSLAVIPTPKSMIRCDALTMLSLRFFSSDYHSISFENRLHHGCVIDSKIDVSNLRQISETQIWDPGLSSLEIGDGAVKSRSDHTNTVCRSTQEVCVDRHKSGAVANSAVGAFFFSALVLVDDVNRMRTRRSNQQHIWVYGTITKNHISFFRRVPKSMVLRCNGWIADFAFRKRKRWYIDKKQMFPKLESHTRLTDKTRATKHIFRIAAPKLLCFFVTEIFDCIYILMFNITIFGSY